MVGAVGIEPTTPMALTGHFGYNRRVRSGLEHRLLTLTTPLVEEATMADLTPIETAHFWSRVAISTDFQCWPWKGRKSDGGYGRFKRTRSHRIAYELINGPIPEGMVVRHHCDNPTCCNPRHLAVGTHANNTRDALDRNRFAVGERSGKTKLTAAQVAYIRANPDRRKLMELAADFGVSASTVSYIRSGRSWKYEKMMVGPEGIEPSPPPCQDDALPLSYGPSSRFSEPHPAVNKRTGT